ncbi:hypothetical protein EXIGLDRAFT_837895, partial [Exidia glandulosa HHB12029]
HVWTSWVATLCLVCKRFRRVVTPILYAAIAVTNSNFDLLITISCLPDTPLRHTTSLILTSVNHWTNHEALLALPLTLALANLSAFTGSTRLLAILLQAGHTLNLLSAYLTDVTPASDPFNIAAVQPVVQTLSRLHVIYDIYDEEPSIQPDLSSSQVEYLVIDLFSEASSLEDEVIDLSPITPLATASPRLRRVLFRARCVREPDAQRVAQTVVEWAQGRRDQRIYVDDTYVPIGDGLQTEWKWKDLDEQDALDGSSLWFRGRQAWYPFAPSTN